MNQQEMADLLEIQQLAARYMAFAARKEQDRWLDVFTADGVYNAFGTPYTLDDFPVLLNSAPPGQYIGNVPLVEFDGDTATGVQHYVFIIQETHDDAHRLVRRRVRPHARRLAHPPAFHHLHAQERFLRLRQPARPDALRRRARGRLGRRHAHRH